MPLFKLYHVVDRVVPVVAMGNGTEAKWPEDYYHLADVVANNEDDVYRLTNRDYNNHDTSWVGNPGVFMVVSVPNPRSTAPGDVVVLSDGSVIRYMLGRNERI